MSHKRTPSDAELEMLANQFRPTWRDGDEVRAWCRKHHDEVLDMVHGDWSWTAMASALTRAGITYRTGRPWSPKGLRKEFARAAVPLKWHAKRRLTPPSDAPSPALPVASAPVLGSAPLAVPERMAQPSVPPPPASPMPQAARFKTASGAPQPPRRPPLTPEEIAARRRLNIPLIDQ